MSKLDVTALLRILNDTTKPIALEPDTRLAEAVAARDAFMARNGKVTGRDLASRDAQSLDDAVSFAENDWASHDGQSLATPAKSLRDESDLASHDGQSLEALAQSVSLSENDLAGQTTSSLIVPLLPSPQGGRSPSYYNAVTLGTCPVTSCLGMSPSCPALGDDMPAASPYGDASLRSANPLVAEQEVSDCLSSQDAVEDHGSYEDESDDADQHPLVSTGISSRNELGYAAIAFWRRDKADGSSDWSISIESAPLADWSLGMDRMPKLARHYVDFGAGGTRRLKSNRITPRVKAGELSPSYLTNIDAWSKHYGADALMGPVGNSRFSDRKRGLDESTKARCYFDDQFALLNVSPTTGLPTRLLLWLNDKTPIVISDIKRAPSRPHYGTKPKRRPVALAWYDPNKLAAQLRHDLAEAERLQQSNAKLTGFHPRNELLMAMEMRIAARDDEIARLQDTVSNLSRMVETLISQLPTQRTTP